jgi:hypothetical protein
MVEPTVPPPPPPPFGPDRPLTTPPPVSPPPERGGPPWGKIALFGCLGLLIIGILLAVIGFFVYRKTQERDEVTEQYIEERQGEGVISGDTVVAGGGTPIPNQPAVISGSLDTSDLARNDGSFYDEHRVDLSSGSTLTVTMRSTDFDAYLTMYSPSAVEYSDDDGAGGSDARIEVADGEAGQWKIWANSYGAGQTGSYTLTIERSP